MIGQALTCLCGRRPLTFLNARNQFLHRGFSVRTETRARPLRYAKTDPVCSRTILIRYPTMRLPRVVTCSLLALFALLFARPNTSLAQEADEILQQLEQKYQTTLALEADFSQTTTSAFSDLARTFRGTLLLQGDRYRVETDQQTIVTNGQTTWIYTPAEQQVIVSDYEEDETAFVPSEFFYHYRDRFSVTSMKTVEQNGETYNVLQMEPKQANTFYRTITLWVRAHDALITRLKVENANDTQMVFNLKNVEFRPPVSADAFTFSPPPEAEVIDLRS